MTAGPLHYLDFDYSDDEHGHGSFDAMAAAAPAQLRALQDEVARVLDWAHAQFGAPGPLDEGAAWDCELQGVREVATTLAVRYRSGTGLELHAGAAGEPRVTLSVTLTGTPAFCAALREAFALEY
ncbi:hypothetical protein [Ramlibacter alkalitolerans]|uniref:Uncharacterized protein n=1 Tax=Ramlibacter alkalitolerans TaxID=2039631 RepID=A0ABS1JQE2_9BURK|nr:hypothetical protein [Ramlibacter alkalitolerans]MBL0426488.1 hypothetical protein [Ramlibacter alkalitolerans]